MSLISHRWVADDDTLIAIRQVDAVVSARVPAGDVLAGIHDQVVDPLAKRLRPLLLLLGARAAGRPLGSRAFRAAAAIEILHEATLVHDDIVDASGMRRGRPSVQDRHGLRGAAYGGSGIMYAAMSLTSDLPDDVRQETARTAAQMARSQVEEVTRAHDHSVTPMRRLRIMYGKTASLFRLAALCGARLGHCEPHVTDAIVRSATLFGMAYQLADDMRDLYLATHEDADMTRCDLVDGIATLPILFSLTDRVGVVARVSSMREQIAAGQPVPETEIRQIASLIVAGDGMSHATAVLQSWGLRIRAALDEARSDLPTDVYGSFISLLQIVDASALDGAASLTCPMSS